MKRIRLPAIGLCLLFSSTAWADLRSYDVDFRYRQEVYEALKDLLNAPPNLPGTHGRVELLPSGQILVNATPETLEQVDQVLRAIRERSVAATPRVTLRYWAVLGVRSQDSAREAPGTPVPAVLNGVLAELERLHGELAFRVIGTAAVTAESGQKGEISGMTLSVEQTAYAQDDTLSADIEMELHNNILMRDLQIGTLGVRTTLQRGEFVVLGESVVQGGELDGPVFYIVHWPESE
jgi:hypothetical protein